jgi:hypothetical protein
MSQYRKVESMSVRMIQSRIIFKGFGVNHLSFNDDTHAIDPVGEEERVSSLRHNFKNAEWEAVARILVKGFKDRQFFQYSISRTLFIAILLGESSVTNEMLISSFKAYVSEDERELIGQSLNTTLSDEQIDEWLDLFGRFSCKRVPKANKEDVEKVLLEVAHKEMIKTSKYVIDSWIKPLKKTTRFTGLNSSQYQILQNFKVE